MTMDVDKVKRNFKALPLFGMIAMLAFVSIPAFEAVFPYSDRVYTSKWAAIAVLFATVLFLVMLFEEYGFTNMSMRETLPVAFILFSLFCMLSIAHFNIVLCVFMVLLGVSVLAKVKERRINGSEGHRRVEWAMFVMNVLVVVLLVADFGYIAAREPERLSSLFSSSVGPVDGFADHSQGDLHAQAQYLGDYDYDATVY